VKAPALRVPPPSLPSDLSSNRAISIRDLMLYKWSTCKLHTWSSRSTVPISRDSNWLVRSRGSSVRLIAPWFSHFRMLIHDVPAIPLPASESSGRVYSRSLICWMLGNHFRVKGFTGVSFPEIYISRFFSTIATGKRDIVNRQAGNWTSSKLTRKNSPELP